MPLGMELGFGPGHIVLDGDPASHPQKRWPNFRPMSIVAKRSPISDIAEHLFFIRIANRVSLSALVSLLTT